ncbi:MAG: hypothetical protein H7Y88_00900 [Phycisphaerales bacterium]|nr:hypothetical protein [Phycisphaerales bacterium]
MEPETPSGHPQCPKCSSPMEGGVVADGVHAGERVALWVRGYMKRSWLGYEKLSPDPQDRFQIAAFRCTQCGFIEHYAVENLPVKRPKWF